MIYGPTVPEWPGTVLEFGPWRPGWAKVRSYNVTDLAIHLQRRRKFLNFGGMHN